MKIIIFGSGFGLFSKTFLNTLAAILKLRNAKFLFLYAKLVFSHLKKSLKRITGDTLAL